jgi:hypothetical protein
VNRNSGVSGVLITLLGEVDVALRGGRAGAEAFSPANIEAPAEADAGRRLGLRADQPAEGAEKQDKAALENVSHDVRLRSAGLDAGKQENSERTDSSR